MPRAWKSGHKSPDILALDAWLAANEKGHTKAETAGVLTRKDGAKLGNDRARKNRSKRKAYERVARWREKHRGKYRSQQRRIMRRRRKAKSPAKADVS